MQIKPFTMSVVIGSTACNARCPFCISKQTFPTGEVKAESINWGNWHQACTLAAKSGVTTILLTGKGEPTLFPKQITEVLNRLADYNFPIIELQTNGIQIADGALDKDEYLDMWYARGLRTICISNVGIDAELNRQIYTPHRKEYIDLSSLIKKLHHGFSVRLSTMMIKGGVDSLDKFEQLIQFCKTNSVEQLTIRPINKPNHTANVFGGQAAFDWTTNNGVDASMVNCIYSYLKDAGNLLLKLPHGAEVYDYKGQNVCMSNCLTHDPNPECIRQLIYFPNGKLRYSWEYEGAIII